MPKKRKNPENNGLPSRWQHRHGAYYYHVPPGLENLWDGKQAFRLGKTLSESYRVWAARLENNIEVRTISDLLDRYALEVIPKKAVSVHQQQHIWVGKLRGVFGDLPVTGMKPRLLYKYLTLAAKRKPPSSKTRSPARRRVR